MKTAKDAALKLLNISPRSEQELRAKLHDKYYTEEEIDEAVSFCKKYNYINDEEYAKMYISYNYKRYGKNLLKQKLIFDKKVDSDVVKFALMDQLTDEMQIESATEILEKYVRIRHLTEEDKQKIFAHLATKGISYDIAKVAFDEVFGN